MLLTDVAGQWALLQSERALVPSVHSMIAINGALVLFCVFYSTKNIVLAPVACGSARPGAPPSPRGRAFTAVACHVSGIERMLAGPADGGPARAETGAASARS